MRSKDLPPAGFDILRGSAVKWLLGSEEYLFDMFAMRAERPDESSLSVTADVSARGSPQARSFAHRQCGSTSTGGAEAVFVACQRDRTGVLPRVRDHRGS